MPALPSVANQAREAFNNAVQNAAGMKQVSLEDAAFESYCENMARGLFSLTEMVARLDTRLAEVERKLAAVK